MPRGRRDMAPGLFHIWSHSVWTSVLYQDDVDRVSFIAELAATAAKYGWTCVGFCVMKTHYHILAETFDESLGDGMKRLNLRHACRFNSVHGTRGHVFGGRYKSKRITTEEHLLTTYRYVARNPVAASLCEAPGDWRWGSYRTLIEPAEPCTFVDVSRVTGCFRPEETALEQLRRFVDRNG